MIDSSIKNVLRMVFVKRRKKKWWTFIRLLKRLLSFQLLILVTFRTRGNNFEFLLDIRNLTPIIRHTVSLLQNFVVINKNTLLHNRITFEISNQYSTRSSSYNIIQKNLQNLIIFSHISSDCADPIINLICW